MNVSRNIATIKVAVAKNKSGTSILQICIPRLALELLKMDKMKYVRYNKNTITTKKSTQIAKDIKVLNQVIFPATEGDKIHFYLMEKTLSP